MNRYRFKLCNIELYAFVALNSITEIRITHDQKAVHISQGNTSPRVILTMDGYTTHYHELHDDIAFNTYSRQDWNILLGQQQPYEKKSIDKQETRLYSIAVFSTYAYLLGRQCLDLLCPTKPRIMTVSRP